MKASEVYDDETISQATSELSIQLSPFIFTKLRSLGGQQIIFDYFSIGELISIRNLNRNFFKLLAKGTVPSQIFFH